MLEKTVSIKKGRGLVSLEIKARNATAGNLEVYVYTSSGSQPIGQGVFGDSNPDVYEIPFDVQELEKHPVTVIGKFCPGNSLDYDTIAFDLNFIQMEEVSDTIEFREKNEGVYFLNCIIYFNLI